MLVPKRTHAVRTGFTLMEMLVVVAIIVTLAGLGGYYFINSAENAKKQVAHTQVKTTLTQAVEAYRLEMGEFPQSLDMLLQRVEDRGPWLKTQEALIDPWGQPYQYNMAGSYNNGLLPDIWAEHPQHGQIGNWMIRRN